MCITADSAAVNTGRIIQEIKGHSRPVTRRGRGLEGREEGDLTWYQALNHSNVSANFVHKLVCS